MIPLTRFWVASIVVLFSLIKFEYTNAADVVTLASGERPPYVGTALPANGYVAEVAREAFKRKGYTVEIKFYPWARAKALAADGNVDGVLPTYYDSSDVASGAFVYSEPFPGDTIGLLKKKTLKVSYNKEDANNQKALFKSLSKYSFGVVRDGVTVPAFEEATSLKKETVNDDIQNLEKLDQDRIQLALVDKYSAADLMVGQRPHLIGKLEFMQPPLAQRDFYVAFSKKGSRNAQLATAFNEGLAELKRDGALTEILERHGLFRPKQVTKNKVRLTIGTVNNGDMLVMQQLSKTYETQHPNIELEWRVLDEGTLRLRLLSDLAISDGQFDIMTIGAYEAPIWAKEGWLTPLSLSGSYDVNDILPTVRTALSKDGKLFALPFYAESSMTFYRKDLFAKAGLTMPPAPTYDDVLKFASKIHDPSAGVYGICLRGKAGWGENMAFLTTLSNAYGGRWFDEGWRPELSSPAWNKAVSFYVDLLTKYGPPHPERNGFNENLTLFSEGHCAMWIDATVAAGMLFDPKRSQVSKELGFVPAPVAVTHKGSAWLWVWALAIPNSSNYKKEATDFISWATSKDYIRNVGKTQGWVAAPPGTRKSTYQNESYIKEAPFSSFVLKAIENADVVNSTLKPKPYIGIQLVGIPEFSAIGTQVGMEIEKALKGERPVAEALQKSQTIAEQQMKNSGYIK